MNKTDRLLAIVLELQVKKVQTAEQLSDFFEVSKRTIYRDINSLCESGVPIISKQGFGYSLTDNYFLPPISFTPDETTLILLGLDFIKNTFDSDYTNKALIAENKLNLILSDKQKIESERIKQKIKLISNDIISDEENTNLNLYLKEIRTAILNSKNISFTYFSKSLDSNISKRIVSPYKLVHINNNWYLSAYCLDKKSMRSFRIQRIEDLKLLDSNFKNEIFENHIIYKDNRNSIAILKLDNSIERLLKENNFYYIENIESKKDFIEVVLKYRTDDEILSWILSWGSNIKSIYPNELKEKVKREALKILEII